MVFIIYFSPYLDLIDYIKPNIIEGGWYDLTKKSLKELLQIPDFIPIPNEDNFIIRMLASVAPILGGSQACSDASWTYLMNMIVYKQMWAFGG